MAAYPLIDTLFPSVDDDGLRWVYPRLASGKPTQSPSNGNSPSTPRRYGVGEALAAAFAAEGDDAIPIVPHFTKKCAKPIPAQVGILGLHLRIMAMAAGNGPEESATIVSVFKRNFRRVYEKVIC